MLQPFSIFNFQFSISLLLRKAGYQKVSLSVQKANYAAKMYLKAGFTVMKENLDEYIMVLDLSTYDS